MRGSVAASPIGWANWPWSAWHSMQASRPAARISCGCCEACGSWQAAQLPWSCCKWLLTDCSARSRMSSWQARQVSRARPRTKPPRGEACGVWHSRHIPPSAGAWTETGSSTASTTSSWQA